MRRRPGADLHCPYCYEAFGLRDIEFRCSGRIGWGGRRCTPEPDKVLSEHIDREVTLPPAFAAEAPDTLAACPRCGVSTTTRICPACHRRLPALFGQIPSRMIALVGAKQSGKTVFMTVLVHELMHRLGEQLGAGIGPADDYTGHEFASYYEALLYGGAQLLPPTTPAGARDRTPLVFRLTIGGPQTPGPRRGRGRGLGRGSPARPALLSLFDPAGEDLLSQQSTEQNARHGRYAGQRAAEHHRSGAAYRPVRVGRPDQQAARRRLLQDRRIPAQPGPDQPATPVPRPGPATGRDRQRQRAHRSPATARPMARIPD
jgi:hypothetical protein